MGLGKLLQQAANDDWISQAVEVGAEREYGGHRWGNSALEIHPSSAGSECPLDVQFSMLGYSNFNSQGKRRVRNGTDAHTRWNSDLEAAGLLHDCEVRITAEYKGRPWSGECDLIFRRPGSQKLMIGEIKTMNSARWARIPHQLGPLETTAELLKKERQYVYQVCHYVEVFKQEYGADISDDAVFVFENTNDQKYKILYFRTTSALRAKAFVVPNQAIDAGREGKIIDPPFARASATCRRCYKEKVCNDFRDRDPAVVEAIERQMKKWEI